MDQEDLHAAVHEEGSVQEEDAVRLAEEHVAEHEEVLAVQAEVLAVAVVVEALAEDAGRHGAGREAVSAAGEVEIVSMHVLIWRLEWWVRRSPGWNALFVDEPDVS